LSKTKNKFWFGRSVDHLTPLETGFAIDCCCWSSLSLVSAVCCVGGGTVQVLLALGAVCALSEKFLPRQQNQNMLLSY